MRPASRVAQRIFFANLVAQTAIVVTGGAVRLTGSGLGCPTWPQCMPGSFTPVVHEANRFHAYVEFGNRLLTFVLAVLAIAAVIAGISDARRRKRDGLAPRRRLLLLSAAPLLGTLAQAILGGITVLTALHPATVAAHFMLSMVIIAFTLLLVHRSREHADRPRVVTVRKELRLGVQALVVIGFSVLVVGTIVTGSGPHAGDADMPERFGIDPRVISWLHADLVLLFIGLTLGLLLAFRVSHSDLARFVGHLLVIQLLQGVIGYVQYFTGLPELLVGIHMLGACLVWIATVRVALATSAPQNSGEPTNGSMATAKNSSVK